MTREQLTERILDIKRERQLSWRRMVEAIGGMSDVLIVGALLGQMRLPEGLATKAASFLGLTKAEEIMLSEVPMRGQHVPMPRPIPCSIASMN